MVHSVTHITCKFCFNNYYGVLNDLFQAGQEYATTCPKCSQQNFIRNHEVPTGTLNGQIPENSVMVMHVKVL
ncbi:hypothetical protein BCV44_04630 [Vibrio cyclitrophicus]|nr:hypothetical protein BCV44_04630 [Vibrio cyclitrophicus]